MGADVNPTTNFIAHFDERHHRQQTVEQHLLGVAEKTSMLACKLGIPNAGYLIGLLHDLGKYSIAFQAYIKSATGNINPDEDEYVDSKGLKGKIDHSSAGAQWVFQQISVLGKNESGLLCAQILAICIASHHSGLIDCLDMDGQNVFRKRIQKDDVQTHLQECVTNADNTVIELAQNLANGELLKEMLSVIKPMLRDTMDSTHQNNPNVSRKRQIIQEFYLGFFTRCLFSCLIDADRTDSADFEYPEQSKIRSKNLPNWFEAQQKLENKIVQFTQDSAIAQIRRNISDNCLQRAQSDQGLFTLSVPTGGGKTLASLRFALEHAKKHELDRVFYIIPYTSIIEQNANEVRNILGDEWVLEHHSNLEPEKQTWQSKLLSENWDKAIIFTTMVQFLETLFGSGTRGVRRLHQLSRSVIIFDEIQTLPIHCTHLFCNALNFLGAYANTTAVMCTATQPLFNQLDAKIRGRGQLNIPTENEIVGDTEQVRELFAQLERVTIENHVKDGGYSVDELTAIIYGQFEQHGSCLTIVNTKDWAKSLYIACRERGVPQEALFHLSTNQCASHRKNILDTVRKRLTEQKPVVCISTQLIEAGVDVSFAFVMRFLAGVDSIAQAAGRCNRHGEMRDEVGNHVKGQVWVVNPDKENIDLLPDIKIGQEKTLRVLGELQDDQKLLTPEGVALYFKYYYFYERSDDMVYQLKKDKTTNLLNLLSDNDGNIYAQKNNQRPNKYPLLMQSFMSASKAFQAIDAPTQGLIVPYGNAAGEGKAIISELSGLALENKPRYHELLQQAQKYSVNVFPNVWKKLEKAKAIIEIQEDTRIYYLDERYYSQEFGLSDEPSELMDMLIG